MHNFEKHTQIGKRFESRITVTRSRHIGFPTRFYEDNQLGTYLYAVLFFDQSANDIGIKFTATKEIGAIPLAKNSKGYGGYISATSFFKANRINTKKYAGRYDFKRIPLREAGIDEDGDMYILTLKEKIGEEAEM